MQVGYQYVYQIDWMDEALWLLLLSAPLLLFIGYHLSKWLFTSRKPYLDLNRVVIVPTDLHWSLYTDDPYLIGEITEAVGEAYSHFQPIRYQMIAPFLKTDDAHAVAEQVQEFYIYPKSYYLEHVKQS